MLSASMPWPSSMTETLAYRPSRSAMTRMTDEVGECLDALERHSGVLSTVNQLLSTKPDGRAQGTPMPIPEAEECVKCG